MGIMEHNNDWLAIQQHFLPCKSIKKIFIRQKNCSSSRVPENPIKAVKRMKSSPLTEEEKGLIYEGLRLFKDDWHSLWKDIVPYRNPKMLERQWRIAIGTQKSYKRTEAAKEKRRHDDAKRRSLKECITEKETLEKEVNSEDNCEVDMDCEEEAYVHEAFLADLEPGRDCEEEAYVHEADLEPGSSKNMIHNGRLSCINMHSQIGTSGGHLTTHQSYWARKRNRLPIVQLASYLPPVKLPPSVRVISQSASKIYRGEPSHSNVNDNALKDCALRVAHMKENASESEVQLHPED